MYSCINGLILPLPCVVIYSSCLPFLYQIVFSRVDKWQQGITYIDQHNFLRYLVDKWVVKVEYLQDGFVAGKRLLPEGWAEFGRTPAPGWGADWRPIYGGFFWLNRGPATTRMPIPEDAYFMAGAGGQKTIIVPSHDLVVVRIGHFSGAAKAEISLRHMLKALMESVPERSAT